MYRRNEQGFWQGGGQVAALSFAQKINEPQLRFQGVLQSRVWLRNFIDHDLVTDLGVDIGSPAWFRGLATCALLCAATVSLAPRFAPLRVTAQPAALDYAWEETRAQSIAPLAWGGDTGRRMAANDAVTPLGTIPERPVLNLVATLGQGDGFSRVLERAGVGEAEAKRVSALINSISPVNELAPGTRISMVLGRRASRNQPRPLEAIDFRARFDLALSVTRSANGFSVRPIPISVNRTPLRIQGRFGDSLYRSARAAGAPPKAVESYIRAIASKLSLSNDVTRDTKFDIIVEHERAETGEVRSGKLLYAGIDRGGRQFQLLEWNIGGRTEWFEASGVGQKRAGITSPISGARKTSGFGMRFHPLLGYNRFHRGVDYGAPYGTPIRAITGGLISFAGRNAGYGNHVRINHSSTLGSSYSHMSRIAVSPGARVLQGQIIGYVGSTGMSTGPHLHFEVYRNGAIVNPASVAFESTSLLSGKELAAFRARLAQLVAVPTNSAP